MMRTVMVVEEAFECKGFGGAFLANSPHSMYVCLGTLVRDDLGASSDLFPQGSALFHTFSPSAWSTFTS